ncbi:ATP-binding protein [Amycolatopsis sp. cmx-4-54]|uniref:ATP-binding protein n=1 Tax=Amycolatopsis sp. cmx-4-54 TaxID=2790936 RepID=UPI00397B41DA
MTPEDLPGQFRIEKVQVLNWGAYSGLQVMHVGRSGTAILGPSGRGKSTLLDAMASVIMPNPQEFNQAARDDKGRKRERTIYSYARGHTDHRRDENKRSGTTTYLRPPGSAGFASGTAITWSDGVAARVTAFRLAWVASDTTGADMIGANTVYGFVHDDFDLAGLDGLSGVRVGASPLSKSSLGTLIDSDRGDVVDPSQSRMHAKMRTAMSMGRTDESQRLAMQLLRRAQASKGIFNINALFKEFVLTEPLAMTRWDTALAAYREASLLYDEFEYARKRLDALAHLPTLGERYATAGRDYVAKQRLREEPDTGAPSRLQVWHAEKMAEWAARETDTNRIEHAEVDEEAQAARLNAKTAKDAFDDVIDTLTAAGGDPTKTLALQLENARKELDDLEETRGELTAQLAEFGLVLPTSQGDLTLLQASMAEIHAKLTADQAELDRQAHERQADLALLKRRIAKLTKEIEQLKQRRGNIPEEAEGMRNRIARATRLPADRLPYLGELLQLKPEHRRWEHAVLSVLRGLAQQLAVAEADLPVVRRYVNDNDVGGAITLVRVRTPGSVHAPIANTVPALLDIADSPYRDWLVRELVEHFSYWCVEHDSELGELRPPGTIGSVTLAGMRTGARDRYVKNDRKSPYKWIGWDNNQLRADLAEEVGSLRSELPSSELKADQAGAARDACRDSVLRLEVLQEGIAWTRIDTAPVLQRIGVLEEQLERADTPETRELRKRLNLANEKLRKTGLVVEKLEDKLAAIGAVWGQLVDVRDTATRTIDDEPALTDEERAALAGVPFAAPASPEVAAIKQSRLTAEDDLSHQIEQHKKDRESHEQLILVTIRAYRNIDERTARELDETIESLAALLDLYAQLVTDDLPRAKHKWLRKVDQEMNTQLRSLLVQIDEDGRQIRRGLHPINSVLQGVPFREGSVLTIETVDRPSTDLKEFRDLITRYTSNTLLQDVSRDADEIEVAFVRLRKGLARLNDPTRYGEGWRRRVFDAREHVEFRAIETRADGAEIVHEGVAGMSGGEGQELIAFILGAALRYRLGEGSEAPPTYASIVLDEGFVKADSEYTGRALAALRALGFQLIVGAPREKATAFEEHIETVAYINTDPRNPTAVRIYPMTIEQALSVDGEEAP